MSFEATFWLIYCLTLWVAYRSYIYIKAKAFNDGYKRGRSSLNGREIVK